MSDLARSMSGLTSSGHLRRVGVTGGESIYLREDITASGPFGVDPKVPAVLCEMLSLLGFLLTLYHKV
jgi:hypothetical protein